MIFNDNFLIRWYVPRVSRFYFDRILRMISSLIFFVAAMLSIIWRFVIYFFSIFLFVLSFRVWITLLISLIWLTVSGLSSQPSVFLRRTISPLFFRISRTFRAFCSSISIMALLNWILSLKFSKICSFMLLISSFSSILPQYVQTPSFGTEFLPCLLSILGSLSLFSIFYLFSIPRFSLSRTLSSSISLCRSLMIFLY